MSSLMSNQSQPGATGAGTGAAQQSAAVRSGAVGASGVQGGSTTPAWQMLTPATNQALATGSFSDWLSALMQEQKGLRGGTHGGSQAGMAAFQNPGQAQGSHSVSLASLYGGKS